MPDLRIYRLRLEIGDAVEERAIDAPTNLEAMRAARAVLVGTPPGTAAKLNAPDGMMIWSDIAD